MPLYTYECHKNHQTEQLSKVDEYLQHVPCEVCGRPAYLVMVKGHGGIQTDTPAWIDGHVRAALQDTDQLAMGLEKPIETRNELRDHLKAHGLSPKA